MIISQNFSIGYESSTSQQYPMEMKFQGIFVTKDEELADFSRGRRFYGTGRSVSEKECDEKE